MAFTLGKFSFDKTTLVSLGVVIALLLFGYGIGHVKGVNSVQKQLIENGGTQQSLTGVVQSTSKKGFTLKIDNTVSGGTAAIGGAGGETPEGTWTVKYGPQGANVTSSLGSTGESQELKKGDKVQVSGLEIGKQTIVAQSVSKIVPPTPSPSASPK